MSKGPDFRLLQQRLLILIVGVALGVLPLILVPSGYDAFRFPKVLLLRALAILLILILGLGWIWRRKAESRTRPHDRILWLLSGICVWLLISAILSDRPGTSLWAVVDVLVAVILFLSTRAIGRRHDVVRLLMVTLLPGLVVTTTLILQMANLWHPLTSPSQLDDLPLEDRTILERASLLGNRDDVGLYLLLPFSCALASTRRFRVAGTAASAAIGFGILLSTTLTAIAVAAVLAFWQSVRMLYKHRRMLVPSLAVLIIVAIGSSWWLGSQAELGRRIGKYLRAAEEGDFREISGGRAVAYMSAANMIARAPLFGVGPGQYPFRFFAVAEEMVATVPDIHEREWIYFDMVHNDYLEVAAEGGLPVFFAATAVIILYLSLLYRWRPVDPEARIARDTGLLSTVAMLAGAMTLFPFQIGAVYGSYLMISGLVLGHAERIEE